MKLQKKTNGPKLGYLIIDNQDRKISQDRKKKILLNKRHCQWPTEEKKER